MLVLWKDLVIQREGLEDQSEHWAQTVHSVGTLFQKAFLIVWDSVVLTLKDQSENNKEFLGGKGMVSIDCYRIKAVPSQMDTSKYSLMN